MASWNKGLNKRFRHLLLLPPLRKWVQIASSIDWVLTFAKITEHIAGVIFYRPAGYNSLAPLGQLNGSRFWMEETDRERSIKERKNMLLSHKNNRIFFTAGAATVLLGVVIVSVQAIIKAICCNSKQSRGRCLFIFRPINGIEEEAF